ncbi:hypothetical protein K3495_g1281 [Podosphaera aphanis]|nr:hypothetical protein K3495_g1281 [Podosphaera aphanis]
MIKSANTLISSHKVAGKERIYIAEQLSSWGESTQDEGMSDISDKMGVLLSELGEQEALYAQKLELCRGILKSVRNTEDSVQPSRDTKAKIVEDIARLKAKEPESTKLATLENWLVRAEAENLVAEAQLTNISRKKLKEAYALEFSATIERAEKQNILARHGHRLLKLLDDSPMVPGYVRQPYLDWYEARQIINDAEDDLKDWKLDLEDAAPNTCQGSEYCSSYLGRQEQTYSEDIESDATDGMAKSKNQTETEKNKSQQHHSKVKMDI